jgi:hypothetical protein
MGAASSSEGGMDPLNLRGKVGGTLRIAGFTEVARKGRALHKIPQNVVKARPDEYGTIIVRPTSPSPCLRVPPSPLSQTCADRSFLVSVYTKTDVHLSQALAPEVL